MNGINNKYDIAIEILTPLNIGAGTEKDWSEGVDFVVKDRQLYKLSLKKMVNEGVDLSKLSSYFTKRDSSGLLQLIGNRLDNISDYHIPYPVKSDNDIKTTVKNQLSGQPIVSGSSIKGAIRSILFEFLKDKGTDKENPVFGSSKEGDEFMRFIKFSDVEFSHTEIINTKIFNLNGSGVHWNGGWKHGRHNTSYKFSDSGFNTLYEVIMPHQIDIGSLMLSETTFNFIGENVLFKGQEKRKLLSIPFLFDIINTHTRNYLLKEKKFFETYHAEKSEKILTSIESLISSIPIDNSYCIFKMSAGSGFHSITGDWQFDDYSINGIKEGKNISRGTHNSKPSSKSRKIAIFNDCLTPMGFVKLSIISATDKQEIITKKESERIKKQELQLDLIRQKEEARALEKHLLLIKSEYLSIIKTADSFFDSQSYNLALDEYRKAESIYPDGSLHHNRINQLQIILDRLRREEKSSILEKEGDELFKAGHYSDAKQKYEDAENFMIKSFYEKLQKCEEFIMFPFLWTGVGLS